MKCIFIILSLLLNSSATLAKLEAPPEKTTHPKYSTELTFISDGKRLPATFYGASGVGPHPTLLLLHGYPGYEKNLDIAQDMRDAGWNVIFFHYRGAWGAEGEFGFKNAEDDVNLVTKQIQQQELAEKYKVDVNAISYVGHSMGGHMAVSGILDNPEVRCSVVYDGANLGRLLADTPTYSEDDWIAYGDRLFMLNGWSGDAMVTELKSSPELNLLLRAKKIGTRPILFIAADSQIVPLKIIMDIVKAMKTVDGNQVHYKLIKDDHSFNNNRGKLLAITKDFLNTNCR